MQSSRRSLNANSFNGMLRDITCRSRGVHVMTTAEVCEETDTEGRIKKRASRTHRYCRQFLESIKGTSTDMTKVESLDFLLQLLLRPNSILNTDSQQDSSIKRCQVWRNSA